MRIRIIDTRRKRSCSIEWANAVAGLKMTLLSIIQRLIISIRLLELSDAARGRIRAFCR